MNELTIIEINGEDRFDSRLLASGLGIQHKNLVETLNKYSAEIQMFGKVPFQTEALPSGQSTQYYLLNRNQCDFVGSLSKNTPKVVAFKAMLVASFANAREAHQPAPMDTLDMIIHSAMALKSQNARLKAVEEKIQLIEETRNQSINELLEVERSTDVVPEETMRAKIARIVIQYSNARNADIQAIWRLIYSKLYHNYRVSINHVKRGKGESKLAAAERLGHLPKIYAIVSRELT